MKKFELVAEKSIKVCGTTLFRIRALISFGSVAAGDEGGYVEKESNVDMSGNAWVFVDARVSGNAWVSGDAHILWMSKVGGEFGTLTAFRNKDGGITITRGCFIGSLEEFRAAVKKKHGGTNHEHGYLGLINYIEWHFTELHPFIKE